MTIQWRHFVLSSVVALASCVVPAQARVVTYVDEFTLPGEPGPAYGQSFETLPTNVAPEGATAIQWADSKRDGHTGSFMIEGKGDPHGGVLRHNNAAGVNAVNYVSNLNLADFVPFTIGEKSLLWSVSFDLTRNANTFNWLRLHMNYDPVNGTGLSVEFALGNGVLALYENGTSTNTGINPGLVLGSAGDWGSFVFERYSDGTLRIAKVSGGGATPLDYTLTLANPNYTTGGTLGLQILGNIHSSGGGVNPLLFDNLHLHVAVPEASTHHLLMGVAAGALLWRRRRYVNLG